MQCGAFYMYGCVQSGRQERVSNTLSCPPNCSHRYMYNTPYCYYYESNQKDVIIQVNLSFLVIHVSSDVFVHHQEDLTVFTVSGNVHPSCCRLVSWIIHDTSRQQIGWTQFSSSLCVSNNIVCVLSLHNLCVLYYLLVHLFVLFNP